MYTHENTITLFDDIKNGCPGASIKLRDNIKPCNYRRYYGSISLMVIYYCHVLQNNNNYKHG